MDKLKKADLTELKALKNPPSVVINVLSALMVLLGQDNPKDYRTAKRELGRSTFLNTLATFEVDSVSVETAVEARGYIDDITEESVCKVSKASVSVYNWVQDVLSQVETKKGGMSDTPAEPGKQS